MRARAAALAALAAAALAAPAAGLAAGPDERAAARAAAWLTRNTAGAPAGQQADAIVALRAQGRSRAALRPRLRALGRVAPAYARTAGGAAKVAMAAVAAGGDPRRLAGEDYIARITARYGAGRYGATSWDQALSMLALRAAGRPVPAAAVRATMRARGGGGWSFEMSPRRADAVDTTALLIEALRAAGVPARNPALRSATRWMLAQRNREGGYAAFGGGRPTEAGPTSNVIRALRAMGRRPPAATRAALRRLQERDGTVRFTRADPGSRLLATLDAVIAFSGGRLPQR
ncbi:hypothetical protein [Miltoncostaea marina]|uniref:hypothetical protein n=1 Tax=Miltoncostaea marina TaxID=2843215 RepID=UPI001C3E86D1|nr:hypothetical protein [Miltoncostaea marina]